MAVLFLQQSGILAVREGTARDASAFFTDTSLFGRVLQSLIRDSGQPSVLQVVYVAMLGAIAILTKAFQPPRRRGGVVSHKNAASRF